MSNELEKIQAARFKLVQDYAPYLSRAIWSVTIVRTPGMLCPNDCKDLDGDNGCEIHGTLGVDKNYRLYYDPGAIRKYTVIELVGVLAHESNHLLRMHPERAPKQTPFIWNIAGDCEINDDLEAEFKLPGGRMRTWDKSDNKADNMGYVHPETFKFPENLTAEEYHAELLKRKDMQPRYVMVDCGSAADGAKRDYELAADDKEFPGKSALEKELINKQVAQDVREHIKNQGSDPMGLGRWADQILDSKIDWRKELYAKIRMSIARSRGSDDYTYKTPNFRRNTSGDFILPNLYEPVPSITVVVDTSGSISKKDLIAAVSEINGIFKKCNASEGVTVIACDSSVHSVQKVYDAKQITKLMGGGGTDMGKGLDQADKLRSQVTVVLTDGYTPWPKNAPRAFTVVGLIGTSNKADSIPPWAKVVIIDD